MYHPVQVGPRSVKLLTPLIFSYLLQWIISRKRWKTTLINSTTKSSKSGVSNSSSSCEVTLQIMSYSSSSGLAENRAKAIPNSKKLPFFVGSHSEFSQIK